MRLRSAVLGACGFGIPLALLVLFLPITWGYGGYNFNSRHRMYFVDPSGPAARAGLRQGDRFESMRGMENVEQFGGPAGTTVHLRVQRRTAVVPVNITFEPFPGALGTQQRFNKVLGTLTALGAFIVALLVLFRARNGRVGARASAVLAAAGLQALAHSGALVAGNAVLATAAFYVLPLLFSGAFVWAAVSLLALYPPGQTRVRLNANAIGPWLFLAFCVLVAARAHDVWWGQTDWFGVADSWVFIVSSIAIAVAIIDAVATAPAEFRTPTRWLGGCWLVAVVLGAISPVTSLLHAYPILRSHYADVLGAVQVFFLAFGVAYPVLRHRLVDLNILITRASVFGVVSILIVGIFIVLEWAFSRIFEQSLGVANAEGLGPQAATLAIVLVLGMSARPMHQLVETRMTQVFFRKRLQGVADIRRVAREADASTDARAIMNVACATVQRCLDPLSVAFYLREGDAYRISSCSGGAPASAYQFNDEVPLRLRRWQEPFEVDDESDTRWHMLFLPMTLRGELMGFLCCGPKPDRTLYLPDEVEALALLAHQVGIAAAWLGRIPLAPPSLSVVAT